MRFGASLVNGRDMKKIGRGKIKLIYVSLSSVIDILHVRIS